MRAYFNTKFKIGGTTLASFKLVSRKSCASSTIIIELLNFFWITEFIFCSRNSSSVIFLVFVSINLCILRAHICEPVNSYIVLSSLFILFCIFSQLLFILSFIQLLIISLAYVKFLLYILERLLLFLYICKYVSPVHCFNDLLLRTALILNICLSNSSDLKTYILLEEFLTICFKVSAIVIAVHVLPTPISW